MLLRAFIALLLLIGCAEAQTTTNTKIVVVTDPTYGAVGDGVTNDTAAIQAAENAAEAMSTCGAVFFPSGQYLIHTGPIVMAKGCSWIGYGSTTYNESAPYQGATLLTDAGTGILAVTNASLVHNGPTISGLNFIATASTRTQVLLTIKNFMRGRIQNSSFRAGSIGIQFDGTSGDMSDWVIGPGNIFNNNVVGVDCGPESAGLGACNNTVAHNYFAVQNDGDIGVRCQHDGSALRVIDNKFDANFPTATNLNIGVQTSCDGTLIAENVFENHSPAIVIPANVSGSNNGRGTISSNNAFTIGGGGSNPVGTLVCTTPTSGTSVTGCSGGSLSTLTGNIKAGMIVLGGNVNGSGNGLVYGATPGSNLNTITGINTVASVTSGTAFTLGTATSGAGAGGTTLTFCFPVYSFPPTLPYAFVVMGNIYTNVGGGCTAGSPNSLQDGG